ncbi:MAG: arginine repressor [Lachnospiraceae bacterium]|nr:arginine repressor [Lachnospiraceae bacterium]
MKLERHKRIIDIINNEDVETQEELALKLEQSGYNVTQATVSRDIRELKLSKVVVGGKQKYALMQQEESDLNEKYLRILRDGVIGLDMAQNILVVKTVAGMAMAVAAAIDALEWYEIAGCIAGDDTIMCAVRTVDDTMSVMERLNKMVKSKSTK